MRLLLVRHTPVGVAAGTCYGSTDVPLAPGWRDDVAELLARLPWRPQDHDTVLSSPASRCRRLAECMGGTLRVDARLAEFDFGAWEGRAWKDIPRAELDAWNADIARARPPGGESLQAVAERATAALQDAAGDDTQRLVLVTHGGVIRALLARLLGLELHLAIRLHVDFGGLCELDMADGRQRLLYMNR